MRTLETRNDIGIVYWRGMEWDRISHFYDEKDFKRCMDFWGNTGWIVGYRDFIQSDQIIKGKRSKDGFGVQVYILYDKDGSIGGVDPSKVTIYENDVCPDDNRGRFSPSQSR